MLRNAIVLNATVGSWSAMNPPSQSDVQGDLFQWLAAARQEDGRVQRDGSEGRPDCPLSALADADLLASVENAMDPGVSLSRRIGLIREVGQRRLEAAVPNLLRVIRLLSAVDSARPAPEVFEAVAALQALGCRDACRELLRILLRGEYAPRTWRAILDLCRSLRVRPPSEVFNRAFALADHRVSAAAARLAGLGQWQEFRPVLQAMLDSLSAELRQAASIGLGLMGDRAVKRALEQDLRLAESPIDIDLLDALAEIGDRDTLVLIRERIRGCKQDSDVIGLLNTAAGIGGPIAESLLRAVADSAATDGVRQAAADLLSELT
jgi:hypothetical protein